MNLRKASKEEVIFLRAIVNHQLGLNIGNKLIPDDVLVKVSPRTGKIREVFLRDGTKIGSIRASSFTFLFTLSAAKIIRELTEPPRLRLIVANEISSDILRYRTNVFSKHVLNVDPNLRAGDEVLVVNEDDELLCVGRMFLSPYEVLFFTRGIAARIRECVNYG